MKIENRKLTQIVDTELREFSMYTIENRAIPSYIDGLKPTQRKLLYAMIHEFHGKRVKINDLGCISKFNYHHGEASAISSAIGMSQSWSNNSPLFTGYGNFGSRLVQESAAPRYIFATLSESFKRYFIDTEVAPKAFDPENPEPAFYLPIIPWVLVNGISGISVGFKSDILPRNIETVLKSTKECLKDPEKFLEKNALIQPSWPDFKGQVVNIAPNQWKSLGTIEYIGRYKFKISELPIGYDRQTYVEFLNTLIDKKLIQDYDDVCSKEGFGFEVKVNIQQKTDIEKDPIKYFKLEKTHTEILTTLGPDGKLKIFDSVAELVYAFVTYRTSKFSDKIQYDIKQIDSELEELLAKKKFIQIVISKKFDFSTMSKSDLLQLVQTQVSTEDWAKRFINIPLYQCTVDEIKELEDTIALKQARLEELKKMDAKELYKKILNS